MASPIHILLVEDNVADIRLTREALAEIKLANKMSVVTDGEAAIEFLYRRGEYESEELPDLILLDLNLPRISGIDVLKKIKTTELIKRIPVVILTSSEAEEDIVRSYDNYANCYVRKPVDMSGFSEIVSHIEGFWFSIVRLPPLD